MAVDIAGIHVYAWMCASIHTYIHENKTTESSNANITTYCEAKWRQQIQRHGKEVLSFQYEKLTCLCVLMVTPMGAQHMPQGQHTQRGAIASY